MGSMAIIDTVVGIAIALVCYLLGFFHGRSNVKAKVEQAVEEGAVSLDAREFTMRQQLDDAIAEIARLRPLADELGRVQNRLKREQAEYDHLKADFNAALKGEAADGSEPEAPSTEKTKPTPGPESADEAIQKLLKSLEQTMREPDETPQRSLDQPPVVQQQPPVAQQQAAVAQHQPPLAQQQPPVVQQQAPVAQPQAAQQTAAEHRPSIVQQSRTVPSPPLARIVEKPKVEEPKKEPNGRKAAEPSTPAVDEWQEFARSLEDLTRRNQ